VPDDKSLGKPNYNMLFNYFLWCRQISGIYCEF